MHSVVRPLIFLAVLVLCTAHGFAQGTKGFSAQTQPSVIYQTQYVKAEVLDNIRTKKITADVQADYVQSELTKAAVVPLAGIAIDDVTRILTIYDKQSFDAVESREGLGNWRVGIVSDGDFSKALTATDVQTPKAGSLGVDAVFMKPVYYQYRYTGAGLPDLTGQQTVLKPYFSVSTLAIVFGQGVPLTTGVAAGAGRLVRPSLTMQRAFGQALLIPGSQAQGGLSFTINGSWFPGILREDYWKDVSIDYNLSLTQTNWSTRDTATSVNILAPSIGIGWRIVDTYIDRGQDANNVQIRLFARYEMRYLFGDVEYHPQLLSDAIGTTRRTYNALNIGVTTSINALRLTVNVPIFGPERIEGFTHGQPVLGFGLAAAIKLKD